MTPTAARTPPKKLSPEREAAVVRALFEERKSWRAIAEELKVSQPTIGRVKRDHERKLADAKAAAAAAAKKEKKQDAAPHDDEGEALNVRDRPPRKSKPRAPAPPPDDGADDQGGDDDDGAAGGDAGPRERVFIL